ncbi:Gfo/Idh/MocA family protein [Chloroflexota bacterium]
MSEKVRVGIVGCGGVVRQTHIPAFLRLKDVTLQAVCDKNENLARETAGKFRIPGAYPDLSEMLSAEKLDIVDICTPPQIHAPLAIEAQQHGCHVLMEKPMALKTSDCDEMLNASHKNGTKLCIIHNRLFDPPFLKARELVTDGAIGDFIGMRILLSDHRDEMIMKKDYWIHKLPGGLVGETGPHLVYMSLAFLNRVKSVDIYAKNFLEHPWAPFDEFRIELEGEKAMSSITLSYTSNRHNAYVDVLGTERILHLDLSSLLLVRYGEKASSKPIPFARYLLSTSSQITGGVVTNAFKLMTGRLKLGHETLIEKFIDSIINDQQPPVTGEEGRETVRVMEMIVMRLREKYGI